MFLWIKNFFQKHKFHSLLIIFFGILMFNSVINLVDLKNYEVQIYSGTLVPYSRSGAYVKFNRPTVIVKHKNAKTNPAFNLVVGQMLDTPRISKIEYTVEYKVYNSTELMDTYIWNCKIENSDIPFMWEEKYYEDVISDIDLSIIDYDIKFDLSVYLWNIFVITGSLYFIISSIITLLKTKEEVSI